METFQDILQSWPAQRRAHAVQAATEEHVFSALQKNILQPEGFLPLRSPAAAPHLELMARRARLLAERSTSELYLAAGQVDRANLSTEGELVADAIGRFNIDVAFLSTPDRKSVM